MSFFKKLKAVRGAITANNTAESIRFETVFLYVKIAQVNRIEEKDIVSVRFTLTQDLTAYNPCTALRDAGLLGTSALFTSSEPAIEGSMPGVIRVLILYYTKGKPIFVYEKGAATLRGTLCR